MEASTLCYPQESGSFGNKVYTSILCFKVSYSVAITGPRIAEVSLHKKVARVTDELRLTLLVEVLRDVYANEKKQCAFERELHEN